MDNPLWPLLAASLCVEPLADGNFLPPSVQNEVEHALSLAPTNAPSAALILPTNGLTRTEIAIRLVSAQRADGRWVSGTNDYTSAAVEILRTL